jgi:hypothetical protein
MQSLLRDFCSAVSNSLSLSLCLPATGCLRFFSVRASVFPAAAALATLANLFPFPRPRFKWHPRLVPLNPSLNLCRPFAGKNQKLFCFQFCLRSLFVSVRSFALFVFLSFWPCFQSKSSFHKGDRWSDHAFWHCPVEGFLSPSVWALRNRLFGWGSNFV